MASPVTHMPMFEYRNQPFKTLYLLYVIFVTLTIRLPYWVITSVVPTWRPRRSWSIVRSFTVTAVIAIVHIFHDIGIPAEMDGETAFQSAEKLGFVWVDALPDSFIQGEIADMAKTNGVTSARIPGYWHGRRTADGKYAQPAGLNEKVIYHLHGGGYLMGTGAPALPAGAVPQALLEGFSGFADRAFGLDYRLSSAAPFKSANAFPAALIDALAGYHHLMTIAGFKPENIIISGDSAGGHLVVALARYLVQNPVFSLPRALILLSPTLDWGCTHDAAPACSMARNAQTDFVKRILQSGYTARALTGALPADAPRTNAWISPASLALASPEGVFAHFPPTSIVAGGAEQTLDAMQTGRDRFVRDNGAENMLYLEYPDASHDFLGVPGHATERAQAIKDLRAWADAGFTVKKLV